MSHVRIRERLRAVSTVGVARSTFLSLSAWRSTIATLPHRAVPWHQAITKRRQLSAGAGENRRIRNWRAAVPLPNPRRFHEQIPVVAQCEAISVCSKTIKHQLALVSVYKKWESAPAPLLSIAHISRALHKDSASVDNRRWAWRVGT